MPETFKYTSTPTSTIIFGVSGLIGSGASFVASSLEEELQSFGYKVTNIKVAQKFLENKFLSDNTEIDIATEDKELLRRILSFNGSKDANSTSPPERIKKLQDIGNSLRKKIWQCSFIGDICLLFSKTHHSKYRKKTGIYY